MDTHAAEFKELIRCKKGGKINKEARKMKTKRKRFPLRLDFIEPPELIKRDTVSKRGGGTSW